MGRQDEVTANLVSKLKVNGTPLRDRRFKTHVRHFYRPCRNGIALAGTLALIYDRANDVVYLGSSPVHPNDIGVATKKHGYRTSLTRAVRAARNLEESGYSYEKATSVALRMSSLPEDHEARVVLLRWLAAQPKRKFDDEDGFAEIENEDPKPHEEDATWLNGTNLLRIYATGLMNSEGIGYVFDTEKAFAVRSMAKWRVLSRYKDDAYRSLPMPTESVPVE